MANTKDRVAYSEEEGGTIIFEGASANLKGGWLELIIRGLIIHTTAIMGMDSDVDGMKAHYIFLKTINLLPQKTGPRATHSREKLYDNYVKLLERRMTEASRDEENPEQYLELNDADKSRVRMEVELEMIGHLTDYVQKYIGIEEELTIDHVGSG